MNWHEVFAGCANLRDARLNRRGAKDAEVASRFSFSALQSSNLLSGCEDFSDNPGVRPSSGAASNVALMGRDTSDALRRSGVAAPEDGRTPPWLRLCRAVSLAFLRFISAGQTWLRLCRAGFIRD